MSTNRKVNLALLMGATVLLAVLAGSAALAGTKPKPPSPGTVQFKSSTYSVAENGASVRIYATRTGGSSGPASVAYATADGTATAGTDYTSKSGTLNWSGGDAADKYFDVTILNDSAYEGDETFKANLSGASGATLGSPSSATVTITDDEVPLPGPAYSLAELKVLQGATASEGRDVNDSGQVVGGSGNHAVVWETPSATPTDLDNGFGGSIAAAINNRGQVAGYCNSVAGVVSEHPVVWIPDGNSGYRMIDLEPACQYGSAGGINNSGLVVGMEMFPESIWLAFVVVPEDTDGDGLPDTWFRDTDGDGLNDLMFLFTGWWDDLMPQAINDDGWVVGDANTWDGLKSFLIIPDYTLPNPWFADDDNDGVNDLLIHPSANLTWATDVNNRGQIVGYGSVLDVVVAEDGTVSITETKLPGPTSSYSGMAAYGINDAGDVVGLGAGQRHTKTPDPEPTLWQKDKGTWLLESLSAMASFTDLDAARRITSHGQIVGHGDTSAGVRGYLATPVPSGN